MRQVSFPNDWINQNPDILSLAYPDGIPSNPLELVQLAISASQKLLPLYDEDNSSFYSASTEQDDRVGVNCFARTGLLHCLLSCSESFSPRIVHTRSLIYTSEHMFNIMIAEAGIVLVADNNLTYNDSDGSTIGRYKNIIQIDKSPMDEEDQESAKHMNVLFSKLLHLGNEHTHDVFWQIMKGGQTIIIDEPSQHEIDANFELYNLRKFDPKSPARYISQATIYSRKSSNKLADILSKPILK